MSRESAPGNDEERPLGRIIAGKVGMVALAAVVGLGAKYGLQFMHDQENQVSHPRQVEAAQIDHTQRVQFDTTAEGTALRIVGANKSRVSNLSVVVHDGHLVVGGRELVHGLSRGELAYHTSVVEFDSAPPSTDATTLYKFLGTHPHADSVDVHYEGTPNDFFVSAHVSPATNAGELQVTVDVPADEAFSYDKPSHVDPFFYNQTPFEQSLDVASGLQ